MISISTVPNLRVATLRWRQGRVDDSTVAAWFAQQGLPELPGSGGLVQAGAEVLWLARRGSGEAWLLATSSHELWHRALQAGSPGSGHVVRAVDLSEAVCVLSVRGRSLAGLLPRLTDAASIPAAAPSASPCLMYDLPVLLLRIDAQEAWLGVDAPLAPTLAEGLALASRYDNTVTV